MPFHTSLLRISSKTGSGSLYFSAAGPGDHPLPDAEIVRMIISAILSWWDPRQ
jgi:hypothetical protein